MFYYLKMYLRDWRNSLGLSISVVFQVYIWIFLALNIKPEMERIFLHYNIIFGVDLLGEWWKIYYLPIAGLLVLIVNSCLAVLVYKKSKFISWLLNFSILFFHIFLLIVARLLVRLNS